MRLAILLAVTFVLGAVSALVLNQTQATESPLQSPAPTAFASTEDAAAPEDHISEPNISVLEDRVIIKVDNPVWARFTPSGSMKPVFDESANAIEIVPTDASQIHLGDIISYEAPWSSVPIIHRVVEIGTDNQGWYAIVKGDNNDVNDPGKIRFSQVRRVVVAIIY